MSGSTHKSSCEPEIGRVKARWACILARRCCGDEATIGLFFLGGAPARMAMRGKRTEMLMATATETIYT